MTTPEQLQMFEPTGSKLSELVITHTRNAKHSETVAENLSLQGFISAANTCAESAAMFWERAFTCEMAAQFEQLAGLTQ